jgi:uncharacterized membrane protein
MRDGAFAVLVFVCTIVGILAFAVIMAWRDHRTAAVAVAAEGVRDA